MDENSLIENTLFLSSIKDGTFDFSFSLKSNENNTNEENIEFSPILFEYIIYKMVNYAIQRNAYINPKVKIISKDYIKQNETILDSKKYKSLLKTIFLIPYLDNSNHKWGLILLSNLFSSLPPENKEVNAKIITTFKNENKTDVEIILKNIIIKLNKDLNNDKIKIKSEILDIGNISDSEKFLVIFIEKLLYLKAERTDDYITELFNDEKKKKIEEILSNGNEIIKDFRNSYYKECKNYLKSIKEKNDENSPNLDNNIDTNLDLNREIENREKAEVDNKISQESEDKENVDDLDELAKKVVQDIMNLDFNESKNKKEREKKNDRAPKEENINDSESIIQRKIKDKEDEEKEEKKEKNEKNIINNIFELNYNLSNNENPENKKIDEVTKNTIDDILDSVLKDMKTTKDKYKKKISKKKKLNGKIFRLKTINIDQKIDIIEEEDKESSTSEIPKEIIKTDKKEDQKATIKNKEESFNKINNSFEIERRPSNFSYNKENYDDTKLKIGEIDFEEPNILDKKYEEKIKEYNKEYKTGNIEVNEDKSLNIFKDKDNEENKIDIKEKINDENKIKEEENEKGKEKGKKIEYENDLLINNKSEFNDNNSNNENLTISNNNSVMDYNSLDNNYNEMDILNQNLISINSNNNYGTNFDKNIKFRSSSPKDNIRHYKNKNINLSSDKNLNQKTYIKSNNIISLEPKFTFNNIIKKNNINNININTINAKNIIIINNTILNHNQDKIKYKKNEIKIEKEPEDEKVPKDNTNKRRKTLEKEPSDGNKNDINNYNFLNELTQESLYKDSKYNSKTINIDKQVYNDKEKNNDFSRNNSYLGNFRINLYENFYRNDNNKSYSSNNLNVLKDDFFGTTIQKKYNLNSAFISNKPKTDINKSNKLNAQITINEYSANTERINKKKKGIIYSNLTDKKFNNNSKKNAKSKTLDYMRVSRKKKNKSKGSYNKDIKQKNFGENKIVNEDSCILI